MSIVIQMFQSGKRLDYALSMLLPHYSRSQIKRWIISRKVQVDNHIILKPKTKVTGGELVKIKDFIDIDYSMNPQNIPLDIIYEDNDIVVINKPSNMVVHPGSGNRSGTVLNALLYKYPSIIKVPRAGIVQRLDKDTSGLMVIAKNIIAYNYLLELFKNRKVIKEYEAIVVGNFLKNSGTINKPISRHIVNRTCMTVSSVGKSAITHYHVIESFSMYSRVRICLETGRTHQIRVHMAYIGHPLVGDQKYGKKLSYKSANEGILYKKLTKFLSLFSRQALHACTLQLYNFSIEAQMKWSVPLPNDISYLIDLLRENEKIFFKRLCNNKYI